MAKKPEPKKAPVKKPTKPAPSKASVAKKTTPQKQKVSPPKKIKEPEQSSDNAAIAIGDEFPFTKEGLQQWYENLEDGVKVAISEEPKCMLPSPGVIANVENKNNPYRLFSIFMPSIPEIEYFGRPVRLRILGSVINDEIGMGLFMNLVKNMPDNRSDYKDIDEKVEIYLRDLNAVSANVLATSVGRALYRERTANLIINTMESLTAEPQKKPEIGPQTADQQAPSADQTPKAPSSSGLSEME